MTEFEAKQAVVDVVGEPWAVEDVLLRPYGNGGWAIMATRPLRIVVVGRQVLECHGPEAGRPAVVGALVESLLSSGRSLPYDRVLREKAAAWAEEKEELEGKIQELEEALRIT
jgi:hypothetical protein